VANQKYNLQCRIEKSNASCCAQHYLFQQFDNDTHVAGIVNMRLNGHYDKDDSLKTRMVQLPATAAIEYVAAGHFFPGGLLAGGGGLSGGLMPVSPNFNQYTHRLGFLFLA